jgi:hypothetical protein
MYGIRRNSKNGCIVAGCMENMDKMEKMENERIRRLCR